MAIGNAEFNNLEIDETRSDKNQRVRILIFRSRRGGRGAMSTNFPKLPISLGERCMQNECRVYSLVIVFLRNHLSHLFAKLKS